MSKSNTTENSWLTLLFNATTWANVAINATSSPLTNLYVSLHTANPDETGTQTTSECAYTDYARGRREDERRVDRHEQQREPRGDDQLPAMLGRLGNGDVLCGRGRLVRRGPHLLLGADYDPEWGDRHQQHRHSRTDDRDRHHRGLTC